MLSPRCIRSKPSLMRSSGRVWVIMGSISILPSMYQSTILGTSVRPRAPPKAVPFQVRPVTSWKGRGAVAGPAGGTAGTAGAARPPLPGAAVDGRGRARADLAPRGPHADHHGHPPAAMRRLQRLAHDADV